jgi:hypothetical protein
MPIEKSFNLLRLDIPDYGNTIKSIFFTSDMWIKILTIQIELYEDELSIQFSQTIEIMVRPLKAMNHRINSKKTDYCIDSVVFLEGQEIALTLLSVSK